MAASRPGCAQKRPPRYTHRHRRGGRKGWRLRRLTGAHHSGDGALQRINAQFNVWAVNCLLQLCLDS